LAGAVQHVHAGETSADDGDIKGGGVAPRCSHAYIVAEEHYGMSAEVSPSASTD